MHFFRTCTQYHGPSRLFLIRLMITYLQRSCYLLICQMSMVLLIQFEYGSDGTQFLVIIVSDKKTISSLCIQFVHFMPCPREHTGMHINYWDLFRQWFKSCDIARGLHNGIVFKKYLSQRVNYISYILNSYRYPNPHTHALAALLRVLLKRNTK